jgi:hypothetical protein
LAALAAADHDFFTRPAGRPEYRARRRATVLAQGAALHYLDGRSGVKDLDVWTFYARLPGVWFPADKRETHADFGPSELGRQLYEMDAARSEAERARWQRWTTGYSGRRVDFLTRALPVAVGADIDVVVQAIRDWLTAGAGSKARTSSAWHLAKKPVILIHPMAELGRIVWRGSGEAL